MKNLLERTDMFSYQIKFNYKGKNFYHSYFGFFLSGIFYISMVYLIYYFGKDMVFKINPTVQYQEAEFTGNISFALTGFLINYNYDFILIESLENIFEITRENEWNYNLTNTVFYPQLKVLQYNFTHTLKEFLKFNDNIDVKLLKPSSESFFQSLNYSNFYYFLIRKKSSNRQTFNYTSEF